MATLNLQDLFKTGGLQLNSAGSSSNLQYGPGYGYYGAQDVAPTRAPAVQRSTPIATQSAQPVQQAGPSAEELARQAYENEQRNSINKGWDSYTNQLNEMLGTGLPGQKSAQEQIANESYLSGVNQLGSQKTSSEEAVNKQQTSSLKDLAGNVRNLFQSGNVYLGSRGAGDSSAADQYSYAITKIGTKARGDILSQANDRMNQIKDIFNNETNRLESEKNTRFAQIADWFNQAQNQIRSQIGQAGLGREQDIRSLSTNIYNQALQAMQAIQSEAANRRSMLESWAASNSKSVGELIQNMQQAQQMPQFQGLNTGSPQVTSEGNYYVPVGYGSSSTQKKDIFGNIIQ